MKTIIYEKQDLIAIVSALQDGKVIAFPTDTVCGVGVVYDNRLALQALKDAKGRDENKPIPMMVSSVEQFLQVAELPDYAYKLIEAFMPGAFTLICKKKETVDDYITNGFDTIAIRIPNDTFVLSLLHQLGKPMLVSSANISNQNAATNEQEVLEQLDGKIHGVVKGFSKQSSASTIVDVSKENIAYIREGSILFSEIKNILEES